MNASLPPLVVSDLSFAFEESPDVMTLQSVTLTIHRGEVVILTGPSGSGKTTLLTLCGALRAPIRGQLDILGQSWGPGQGQPLSPKKRLAVEQALRHRIGFVFQQHNLFKALTAQQNVEMALELHSSWTPAQRHRLAQEMLDLVGLGSKCDAYPAQLSGGQRQRVAVARALVSRPALILADEPTASLDYASAIDVMECFRQAANQWGSAILMVTHDHRLFDSVDRVLPMEDGRMAS